MPIFFALSLSSRDADGGRPQCYLLAYQCARKNTLKFIVSIQGAESALSRNKARRHLVPPKNGAIEKKKKYSINKKKPAQIEERFNLVDGQTRGPGPRGYHRREHERRVTQWEGFGVGWKARNGLATFQASITTDYYYRPGQSHFGFFVAVLQCTELVI